MHCRQGDMKKSTLKFGIYADGRHLQMKKKSGVYEESQEVTKGLLPESVGLTTQ